MVGEQVPQAFDVIAPVAMQLAGHTEPVHQLGSRISHARPGGMADCLIERPGRIRDHAHFVACFQRMESGEGDTDVGDHGGNDKLFAAGLLHRLDKVLIIPGIDLARARNERRVTEQVLSAYPNNPAALNAISVQAKCRKAREFSTFLSQRIKIRSWRSPCSLLLAAVSGSWISSLPCD